MKIQPKGPEGIQQRIQEIQARLDALKPPQPTAAPSSFSVPDSSGLSGPIGKGAGGLSPMNPFGPGTHVDAPGAPAELKGMIHNAATAANIDPLLYEALIGVESSYNPNSVSSAGAKGLSQLMPGTAKLLGVDNPFDPAQSLQAGARYLGQMIGKFGDVRHALAAYNAGPGAVQKFGGVPPFAETQRYVDSVLARTAAFKRGG